MPITITTNQFKFKDPTTGQYRAISAVADESLEERLEAIESAGNTAVSAVTTAQATAVSAIDSKKAEAVASVADAAEVQDMVAEVFDVTKNYNAGDYVIYESSDVSKLYRFTADHAAGAWSGSDAVTVKLANDVDDLKNAIDKSNDGLIALTLIPKKYVNPSTGAYITIQNQTAIDYVSCDGFDNILIYSPVSSPYGAWYDSEKARQASLSVTEGLNKLAVPTGYKYFALSLPTANISRLKVYTMVGISCQKADAMSELNKVTGNNVTITEGKYIAYSSGNIGTVAIYGATEKIPVVGGTKYKVNIFSKSSTDGAGLAFYRDGGYISGVQFIKDTAEYTVTAPDNANQIAISVTLANSAKGYFEMTALNNINDLTEYIYRAIDNKVPDTIPNLFAFNTVGIIGDSLASGCSNYKDDQEVWHALDRKAFAWGKFLEKRQGCSVSLFSRGGMSTRSWFTNENGYAKAVNDPRECYIIGLGVNDFSNSSLGSSYLGSISDVHVGSEDQNADTFYGNYSKIIATLTTIQPRCKIFCLTMPGNQSSSQTRLDFDTAIRTVTALYDNAYLLDLSDDLFFTSEPLVSTWYGAHYLAIGYAMIADHILEVINKYMLNHLSDFMDIQWITNNYPNVDISN